MYKDVVGNAELFKIDYPDTIIPEPKDKDYDLGFIKRYFIKRANDTNAHIFEISDSDYETYSTNPLWTSVAIKWRIRGPLEQTLKDNGDIDDKGVRYSNNAAIGIAKEKIKNIGLYLPNILQFYRK